MGMFDRFRQSRQKSVLPEEVREYYQTEQRQKRGAAFGVALLALLITIAVAAALFFGGKFVYNKVKVDDENKKGQTSSATTEAKPDNVTEQAIDKKSESDTDKPPTPTPAPSTAAPQTAPAPGTNAPRTTTTPAAPTPSTGDALPSTGDEGQ